MSIAGSIVQGSGGGGVATSFEAGSDADLRVAKLESNQAFLTLDNMMLTGAVVKQYVGQAQDLFVDETGVTTKTYMTYDATKNRYSPTLASTTGSPFELLIQSGSEADSGGNDNGSTTLFADSSGNAHTVTVINGTKHAIDQAKFGTSSIYFDGVDDYLTVSAATTGDFDFGTNPFTVEFFFRRTGAAETAAGLISSSTPTDFSIQATSVGAFRVVLNGSQRILGTSNFSADTWYHCCVERVGDIVTAYVDGVSIGTWNATGISISVGDTIEIGKQGAVYSNCHIEEIAITKGSAVYGGAFTPPTEPFATTPQNVTFESDPFVATSAPTSADAYALIQMVSGTLATDITVEVRREGSSSYATATLTDTGFTFYDIDTAETYIIAKVDDVDLSAQTSGIAPQFKLTSTNNPNFYFKGWLMQWG